MQPPEIETNLMAKAIGAVAGAIFALLRFPPKTRAEATRRFVASILSGMIFASLAYALIVRYLDVDIGEDGLIVGACFSAIAGWWGAPALQRAIRSLSRK